MKQIAYILSLFILLSSCAARKKVEKERVNDIVTMTKETVVSQSDSTVKSVSEEHTEETVTTDIYIRQYDTSLPPDTAGNYPLKEEQFITTVKNKDTKAKKEVKKAASENVASETESTTEDHSTEKTDTDTSVEVAGGNRIVWLYIGLVLIGLVLFYLFFIRKKE